MPSTLPDLPKRPLIDTNLLYDYLLWRFSVAAEIRVPEGAYEYLSSDDLRTAFNWYMEKARPLLTSPHVIAEIHGLLRSRADCHGPKLASFWGFAQQELARLHLQEFLVRVNEMIRQDLSDFGPIDCSILKLAVPMESVVLTEDGALKGELTRRQVKVLGCYDVLAIWQEWNV